MSEERVTATDFWTRANALIEEGLVTREEVDTIRRGDGHRKSYLWGVHLRLLNTWADKRRAEREQSTLSEGQ